GDLSSDLLLSVRRGSVVVGRLQLLPALAGFLPAVAAGGCHRPRFVGRRCSLPPAAVGSAAAAARGRHQPPDPLPLVRPRRHPLGPVPPPPPRPDRLLHERPARGPVRRQPDHLAEVPGYPARHPSPAPEELEPVPEAPPVGRVRHAAVLVHAPDALVRRLRRRYDREVEQGERRQGPGAHGREESECRLGGHPRRRREEEAEAEPVLVVEVVPEQVVVVLQRERVADRVTVRRRDDPDARRRDDEGEDAEADQEQDEAGVVPFPYGRADPRAVVVERNDADVARVAVLRPGGTVDVAGLTVAVSQGPAHGYPPAGGARVGRRRRTVRRGVRRYDPRVGERGLPQGQDRGEARRGARPDGGGDEAEVKRRPRREEEVRHVEQRRVRTQHDPSAAEEGLVARPRLPGEERRRGPERRRLGPAAARRPVPAVVPQRRPARPPRPSPHRHQDPPPRGVRPVARQDHAPRQEARGVRPVREARRGLRLRAGPPAAVGVDLEGTPVQRDHGREGRRLEAVVALHGRAGGVEVRR
ncbi:hypothetical protein THAOC_14981, partial [Thalassiosira oceanica]